MSFIGMGGQFQLQHKSRPGKPQKVYTNNILSSESLHKNCALFSFKILQNMGVNFNLHVV